MPLNQVENFIKENGHLPNVPSAEEVKENGINLGEAAHTSLQKIEELTLYVLQINEKVEKQKEALKKQGEQRSTQQELIQAQQKTIALQQQLIQQLKENKKTNH